MSYKVKKGHSGDVWTEKGKINLEEATEADLKLLYSINHPSVVKIEEKKSAKPDKSK